MQNGDFYCFVERPAAGFLGGWAQSLTRSLTKRNSGKSIQRKIDAVVGKRPLFNAEHDKRSSREDLEDTLATSPSASVSSSPQTYVYPGAGIAVKYGLHEIAEGLYRVSPHIFSVNDALVVFYGYLSNLSEVSRSIKRKVVGSPLATLEGRRGLSPTSTLERNRDLGSLTAETILQMYLETKEGEELIFLSELQVCLSRELSPRQAGRHSLAYVGFARCFLNFHAGSTWAQDVLHW